MAHGEAHAAVIKSGGVWSGAPQPELQPGLGDWYEDFFELSTDRQLGMVPGPIPSASISRHTEGWDDEDAEMFRVCIRAMDAVYLAPKEKPVSNEDPAAAFKRMFG